MIVLGRTFVCLVVCLSILFIFDKFTSEHGKRFAKTNILKYLLHRLSDRSTQGMMTDRGLVCCRLQLFGEHQYSHLQLRNN